LHLRGTPRSRAGAVRLRTFRRFPGPPAAPSSVLSLLEHSSEGFIAFDRAWRYVYVNGRAERLLHKSRGELIGRTLWDVLPDADGAAFANEFRRAVD
jgi:PAS domain-containing protein